MKIMHKIIIALSLLGSFALTTPAQADEYCRPYRHHYYRGCYHSYHCRSDYYAFYHCQPHYYHHYHHSHCW